MDMRKGLGLDLGLGLLACVAIGCYGDYYTDYGYQEGIGVTVAVAPPAPLVERPPPQPYGGAAWVSGYWDWAPRYHRYSWVPGYWGPTPRPGVVYVPPSWSRSAHGYYRVPGRWVAGPPYDRYGRRVYYDAFGRPHYF
jgi:hypothetical protein